MREVSGSRSGRLVRVCADAADLGRAAELVRAARRGVAFTGAGVSAESGIRTFRGEDGLWKQYDPYRTASIEHFLQDPAAYWTVSKERWATYRRAQPNAGHRALVELERAGHAMAVVTQNTDGLHRAAGTRQLIELHGNGSRVRCLDCGSIESRSEVQDRLAREMPPRCLTCGSIHLKPDVTFFGEAPPRDAVEAAFSRAEECDLMLVVGSSLVVYPAAAVPEVAVERGAPLVIVNQEATPLDPAAEVVLRARSGEVLPELVRRAAG
jgi:NAD-dependent deacetylase